ncbi:clathrin light chain-domain-containing protein [Catenaria anguillulae PL171]|uniref:Clathrin light chain n=1 Tax=Catenaria anguillulae PL171 TaxID=765915 RepID=A0A1Y2HLQ3_9FUNG|nr:clathrin light chain-domain-containing protein [Catenaria anguillulae PL171]
MADFGDFSSGDPTADFLARERAILGDAAAEFSGTSTSAATGAAASTGLPPEMAAFPPVDAFATGGSGSGAAAATADIFGGGAGATVADGGADVFGAAPVASGGAGPWVPPATMGMSLPLPSSPAQGSSIMGGGQSPVSTTTSTPAPAMPDMETEAIRQWRESFQQTIAERDAAEARAKADAIAKAKADIDKFYEEYNSKRERALQESKVLQERMVADMNDTQSGTFWERVVKNIEIVSTSGDKAKGSGDKADKDAGAKMPSNAAKKQPGGQAAGNQKDITRFKQVLLALKADKNTAPGA